jgi:hypothetical protein
VLNVRGAHIEMRAARHGGLFGRLNSNGAGWC